MALSEYEEQVVAELEAQFQTDTQPAPRRDFSRLALPLIVGLGGVAILAVARDAGLVIRMSDLWGFATASVKAGLSLAGHVVLLGSAFLLGRAWREFRQPCPGRPGLRRPAVSRERV
jgi:hypothetical protein